MGFQLGNHFIEEILIAAGENSDGDLLYTLDQLSEASIEISAESTDITDKKGNLVKTLWRSKSGTFSSSAAFLHPAIMNAGSGSDMQKASEDAPIVMPAYAMVNAGETVDLTNAITGTIKVSARSGNGADVKIYSESDLTSGGLLSGGVFTAPTEVEDAVTFFVEFDQKYAGGVKLINDAETFPKYNVLKLFCSYQDPCGDESKLCVVKLPRFMADPNMTLPLNGEDTTIDFNGTIAMDFCSGTQKVLYEIYYPDQSKVVTGEVMP